MMNRRALFGTAAGAAAVSTFFRERTAHAKMPGDVELRGTNGRLERLGTLDLESQQDFTLGFRVWQAKDMRRASAQLLNKALIAAGADPKQPMTYAEMLKIADANPQVNLASKTWLANQQVTWKTLQDYFHQNADMYLSEMEANDKTGPGTLELNSGIEPEYTRHEIHIQPGGYVGDPFAGHIYHYGTNSFYIAVLGHNEQDQIHKAVAAMMPLPADGKVKRILDAGCGIGQMTLALKERFPDAEVWGLDIGGPMVRYAHMRANDIGLGANFRHALAEDTKFPDGYFDIVTSYIMHHELPAEKTIEVIKETQRITRAGGVYSPLDFNTGGLTGPASALHSRWWDHRWNNEVWSLSYQSMNFSAEIAKAGFKQEKGAKPLAPQFGNRHFVRV
ncbi:MAG: class I SAM-dependent methyltransferase [Rhodospirillaceae bacterium]|nr:class I SAM-dependent methyltransferase [Rhodospirillaceae bacterium]